PVFQSLYVANRNPGVNDGRPIQQGSPGDPLNLRALAQCFYEPAPPLPGFNQQLDGGLHGAVHVLVGNPENMADVPFAPRDAIFWLHHCNIDRLWASWNAGGRTNPSLNQTFTFADPSGQRVDLNLQDFMDIATLGYSYDQLENVPPCPHPMTLAAVAGSQRRRAMVQAKPVVLGSQAVKVTLEATAPPGEQPVRIPAHVAAMPRNKKLYLVAQGLSTTAQPGVLYDVYLDLPANPTGEQLSQHHIGTLNFLHAGAHKRSAHVNPQGAHAPRAGSY